MLFQEYVLLWAVSHFGYSPRNTISKMVLKNLDEALGAKSFPQPYLAPNIKDQAIHRGINYASGASGILDETGTLFVSITQQIVLINFSLT